MDFKWIPEYIDSGGTVLYAANVPRTMDYTKFFLTNSALDALFFDTEKECIEWIEKRNLGFHFAAREHGFGP